jgi:hypothetical protein
MRSPFRLVLWSVAAVVLVGVAYGYYRHVTHVRTYLEERLGLRDFAITQKAYTSHQWYAKVTLSTAEAARLRQRFAFTAHYTREVLDQARKPQNGFIKDCAACYYYLDTRGTGGYGYVLQCLHPDQQLEIFSEFGD